MSHILSNVLLPNAMQQLVGSNGQPLAGAKIYFYEPGTTTTMLTYLDEGMTTPNDNPITADANGRFVAWGEGIYRQVVYDSLGNLQWDLLTSSGTDPDDEPSINVAYDLPIYMEGAPSNGEVYPVFNIVRDVSLPIGLAGSIFAIGVNPTSDTTYTFKKNSTVIGTVVFHSTGLYTITFTAEITFAPFDQFSMTAQNPADATAAFFSGTIVFTVL